FTRAVSDARSEYVKSSDDELPSAMEALGDILNSESLFWVQVSLHNQQVILQASLYDLLTRENIKTAVHRFAYNSQPETYAREVGDFLARHFGEDTLREDTRHLSEDKSIAYADLARCLGVS